MIGRNVVDGRGYSFYSQESDGIVKVDESHTGLPIPSAFMPPAYTFVVAGAQSITGSDGGAKRLLQWVNVLAAAAAICLIYVLGRELFGRTAGVLAALGFAMYPVLVYQVTQASASNVYLPLDLAGLYLLLRLTRRPSLARAVPAGLVAGAICLFRAEAVVLIPLAAVWLIWALRRRQPGPARRTVVLAFFFVSAIAMPAGWIGRNAVVLHGFSPAITSSSGFNLWVGNHAGSSGSQKRFPAESPDLLAKLSQIRRTPSYELHRDRVYRTAALSHVRGHLAHTALLDLKKLGMTITVDIYDHRARNPIYLSGGISLAALGIWGIVLRGGRSPDRLLLYGYMVFGLLVPSVFFTLVRYKLALEVPLLLFAGSAVSSVVERRIDH
ncbi:MAG: glycosyltransferase family 39 protein [Actinomycetota bacterium]|nr:glycosyltransferase family 39 protein [Actinomycetota bacterium]